jgi:ribosome-associated toxin RatA of RatAB toxin-antitoxin module
MDVYRETADVKDRKVEALRRATAAIAVMLASSMMLPVQSWMSPTFADAQQAVGQMTRRARAEKPASVRVLLASLNDSVRRRLAAGEIVTEEREPTNGKGIAFRSMRILRYAAEVVWPVVRDCDHFEEFLPHVVRSERRDTGGTTTCTVVTDLPFPLGEITSEVSVTFDTLEGGGHRRSWTLLRGDYVRNNGSWTVVPWDGETGSSLAINEMDVEPESMLPTFLVRAAQYRELPRSWAAIEARVRALASRRQ